MAEGFAAIPTWMVRDTSVPRSALLVYASLSSRAGLREIYPSQSTIAEESGLSERTVRTMLKELEARGVLTRERRKRSTAGRSTDGYRLHPNGLPANSAGSEGLPEAGIGSTGNEQQVIPLIEVDIDEVDNPLTPTGGRASDSVDDEFAVFYAIYPRKAGKQAALKAFGLAAKRAGGTRPIMEGVRRFANDPNLPEARFIPHPATWLNQGRWEDEPLPPRGGGLTPAEQMAANLRGGGGRELER